MYDCRRLRGGGGRERERERPGGGGGDKFEILLHNGHRPQYWTGDEGGGVQKDLEPESA